MAVTTGLFSILFIWFTLFPGRVDPAVWQFFSEQQVDRGREYNGIPRLAFITGFTLQWVFLFWLVFSGRVVTVSRLVAKITGGTWIGYVIFFLCIWLLLTIINLPFSYYTGYLWQHKWGFSTQTLGSWWYDLLKSSAMSLLLTSAGVVMLFALIKRWPSTWWLMGAGLLSIWLVVQVYLWPVAVSPLFNKFEEARDPAIIDMVQELSLKADLPVDQILIMDASKRTTKANAYFSGLGGTKRIVLYDNLIKDYSLDEVKAVLAHEMAHWKQGHIVRGLALGILGNFLTWGLAFIVLSLTMRFQAPHPPPYTLAVLMLFFMLITFIGTPLQNYVSRGMEMEADRVSVQLTGDPGAASRLQINLAAKNLSDVSPPAFIQWFSYSHPPVMTRIKIINAAGL